MTFAGWDTPLELVKYELTQLRYEGVVVTKDLNDQVAKLAKKKEKNDMNFEAVGAIYDSLSKLKVSPSFRYDQPNNLAEIRKRRQKGPRQLATLDTQELFNKLHGAWTGRAAGCALGKPVEGMGINGKDGVIGRKIIRSYLENRNHWPLDHYFSGKDVGDQLKIHCPKSHRENIAYMEPDDDIHYTLIALKILEEYGPDFTWRHVAHTWNQSLPYNVICTAETQAILNYNNAVPRKAKSNWATPEYTSSYRNPYREWIGAQIRADGWGYACAGNPELAAEFAYRDACWTHRANGIYGEMMFAAIIAAAFVESNPRELINIGLSEIPKTSRLAEATEAALDKARSLKDFYSYMDWVEANFGELSGVHTVNNALVVIGAMIYGDGDFHKSVCLSVEGGWDTDCNGATCGSILGASKGHSELDSSLVLPLNDTIKPSVIGFQKITMTELARRMQEVQKTILAHS